MNLPAICIWNTEILSQYQHSFTRYSGILVLTKTSMSHQVIGSLIQYVGWWNDLGKEWVWDFFQINLRHVGTSADLLIIFRWKEKWSLSIRKLTGKYCVDFTHDFKNNFWSWNQMIFFSPNLRPIKKWSRCSGGHFGITGSDWGKASSTDRPRLLIHRKRRGVIYNEAVHSREFLFVSHHFGRTVRKAIFNTPCATDFLRLSRFGYGRSAALNEKGNVQLVE